MWGSGRFVLLASAIVGHKELLHGGQMFGQLPQAAAMRYSWNTLATDR
jgi:hypothetical protein